jgi:hypothetical protein
MSKEHKTDYMYEEVQRSLNRLQELFISEMKLTFIARLPGNHEADVIITVDDLSEIAKLIERRAQNCNNKTGK